MKFWHGVISGFLATIVVLAAFVYGYFSFGFAPVATAAPPMPFEAFLAHRAQHAVLSQAAHTPSPVPPSEAHLLAGAKVYRAHCAVCHGLPGREMTAIAKGMFPKVPQLFHGKGVTDDEVGETFWKVKHGIRLTGMPGFGGSLTDDEMWQVSQLVALADKLPNRVSAELALKD